LTDYFTGIAAGQFRNSVARLSNLTANLTVI
jgi:hypothetical protein